MVRSLKNWVVVRPGGLVDGEGSLDYQFKSESYSAGLGGSAKNMF